MPVSSGAERRHDYGVETFYGNRVALCRFGDAPTVEAQSLFAGISDVIKTGIIHASLLEIKDYRKNNLLPLFL